MERKEVKVCQSLLSDMTERTSNLKRIIFSVFRGSENTEIKKSTPTYVGEQKSKQHIIKITMH